MIRFSNKNVVNNEAKTLVYNVIKNPASDDNVEYENKNIFKTTIILKDNHNNGMGYYNVYSATVIHPFEMAVKEINVRNCSDCFRSYCTNYYNQHTN